MCKREYLYLAELTSNLEERGLVVLVLALHRLKSLKEKVPHERTVGLQIADFQTRLDTTSRDTLNNEGLGDNALDHPQGGNARGNNSSNGNHISEGCTDTEVC
jgi:hypothetical protein